MTKPRSDTRAKSAAPANALRVWTIGRDLMVEVGAPTSTVLRLPLSGAGLSKALALIAGTPYDFGGGQVTSSTRPATLAEAHAEAVLRRRGIIR